MNVAKTIAKISSPTNSLDAYLMHVKQIPLLSAEVEQSLAEDFYYRKDLSAARQLVISNLRFVVYIAQGYAGYGLGMGDMIQEGNIGLMKAVKRFNPNVKVRLISFAVHWIKAEIQEFILRNWRIVKVATTKAKRKLFFNLRKARQKLGWANSQEVDTIAKNLGVKSKTVLEMETHLGTQDMSFESHTEESNHSESHDSHTNSRLPVTTFSDSRYDPAYLIEANDFKHQGSQALKQALSSLDKRSQDILIKRWLTEPKATLVTLAQYYQLSVERIRQLEQNAMRNLRHLLEAYA